MKRTKVLKNILHQLLMEKGAKKIGNDNTYLFLKPTLAIKETKSGYKYTISKVITHPEVIIQAYRHHSDGTIDENGLIELSYEEYKKDYEAV